MKTTLRIVALLTATLMATACKEDAEASNTASVQDKPQIENPTPVAQTDTPKPLTGHVKDAEDKTLMKEQTSQPDSVTITGTVTYKDLEGGFYGLVAEDGKKYTLQKFPNKYLKNGLVVKVTGTLRNDIMTIQQFGTPLEADKVEVIDDSKVKPANNNNEM